MQTIQLGSTAQHRRMLAVLRPLTDRIQLVCSFGSEKDDALVAQLEPCLMETRKIRSWLGTVSRGPSAVRLTYRACREVFVRLEAFPAFFVNTTLPNGEARVEFTSFGQHDIAFLDAAGEPLFYTTTHEGLAYLKDALAASIGT